jgi:predicted nucleic acid-binding protein
VALIGPVRQEVFSGIQEEAAFDKVCNRLRAFPDEPLDRSTWEEAARAHNACRAAGIAGSAVDFLICAAALRGNLALLTTDRDFSRYARILPLTLLSLR